MWQISYDGDFHLNIASQLITLFFLTVCVNAETSNENIEMILISGGKTSAIAADFYRYPNRPPIAHKAMLKAGRS